MSAQLKQTSLPAAITVEETYPKPGYAWYVVGVLMVAYIFSFIDRQILALLVQPIRRDLGISDTGMSLLMGFSFAVFYSFFGILLGRLADSRSRRTLNVGFALLTVSPYGNSAWAPTFFIRHHGWTASRIGIVYGVLYCIFGVLGVVAGGRFSDSLAERGYRDANMRVALIAALGWLPSGVLYLLVPDAKWAAILLAPTIFFVSAPWGVAAAAIQQMMPNTMRGQASALYLFTMNLIGLGLGPTAVALMTDYVFHDDQAVNYSILLVGVTAQLAGAALLWAGLKPFLRSLDRLEEWMTGE